MIIAVQRDEADLELLDQVYRLRAKCFHSRRGWNVSVKNGQEIDNFDDLNPLYLVSVDGENNVLGSLRLLQTTGPTMLETVFDDVLGKEPPIKSPLVWESTRFCVDTQRCKSSSNSGVNHITSELLEALFTIADAAGLDKVVSVYDLYMERILRRSGCLFDRYGEIAQYDRGLKTVAGVFDVGPHVIESIRMAAHEREQLNVQGQYWQQLAVRKPVGVSALAEDQLIYAA